MGLGNIIDGMSSTEQEKERAKLDAKMFIYKRISERISFLLGNGIIMFVLAVLTMGFLYNDGVISKQFGWFLVVVIPASFIFLLEWSASNMRKKYGLSYTGQYVIDGFDVKENSFDENMYALGDKSSLYADWVADGGLERVGHISVSGVSSGKDLGYWHGLLKSGAITEDEYAVKKEELL
ncbi:hypothetical protein JHD48_01545 [Sulfurimonas sp. SAG-AH-194-I05]|nr:SHOCT domain-containing protein [Sulfurimonas sp. SAG-AH-194-I05]MDF1874411.1 hypothetical protein [Sulfurimonas sp. SAG-AH-194-I05]